MIYLDYTADTPADERVLKVYADIASEHFANPNSAHSAGRAAKKIIDDSLSDIADILGVKANELIFTSGASESNNLAVLGAVTIGVYMFGIIGAIISIPIAGCIKILIEEYGKSLAPEEEKPDEPHKEEKKTEDKKLIAEKA